MTASLDALDWQSSSGSSDLFLTERRRGRQRGDKAQKAGLRFHRSANARWLRSEVTRSTLQLAQTSLLLRSTQQRSLTIEKKAQK